jgi:magnesium transporter
VQILRAVDPDAVAAARERGEFVWVDLVDPDDDEVRRLGEVFGLHPLSLEDSQEFLQLPKIDHYGDYVLLVFYGARVSDDGGVAGEIELVETHLFVADHWLVTVRRAPCVSLEELRDDADPGDDRWMVYRVIDALTDSFFPVMHALEQRIETLEEEVLEGAVEDARRDIVVLRKPVLKLGRVLASQRDTFDRAVSDLSQLPGLGAEAAAYFADVQDHLRRLAIRADTERERLTGAIHLADSVTNTRLAKASERLSLIATIFLPLTAVASFFGMNFSWMIDQIDTAAGFLALGVGFPALTLLILVVYIRRHGYLE